MSFDNPAPSPPSRKTTSAGAIRAEIDRLNAKTADVNLETAELRLNAARLNAQAAESDRKTRRNLRIMDVGMAGQALGAVAIVAICFFYYPAPRLFPLVQAMATLFFCGVYTAVDRRTLGTPIVALSAVTMATATAPIFWETFRRTP